MDAADKAKQTWNKSTPSERSNLLLKIANRLEENLELLAVAETWENGKPIRETLAADIPLAIDHFRYFAGCIRAQEGGISQIDEDTVAYHYHEPIGVVGQIIPWNFPILMAAWKIAPALAAGNCIVLKPAEQTPVSILVLIELIEDLLPAGILNVVNGYGPDVGEPLATIHALVKLPLQGLLKWVKKSWNTPPKISFLQHLSLVVNHLMSFLLMSWIKMMNSWIKH